MDIATYIDNLRQKRGDLSFAFLAERCPTSKEAPYRIRQSSLLRPDENCVLVLPGTGDKKLNLRQYNGMLKQADNFVKENINLSDAAVRVCVAVCDFGKRHIDDVARQGAYYEVQWPQYFEALKQDIPQDCVGETFNPLYIQDIYEQAVRPRIVSENGNERLPLHRAQQNIRRLNIVAHCHGAFVATQMGTLMNKEMDKLGYSPEEQKKIKSQLLILAYNPDCPKPLSEYRFISVESSQNRHNKYLPYVNEWLLMSPQDFGVCFIPEIRTLMCAQVDKSGVEGNPHIVTDYNADEWFENLHGVNITEKRLGEHSFLGFEPVSNMSKGALKLQHFANTILKNAIQNSQQQSAKKFIPLPSTLHLGANGLWEKYEFARATFTGHKLMRQLKQVDKAKIDQSANIRRSCPVITLD